MRRNLRCFLDESALIALVSQSGMLRFSKCQQHDSSAVFRFLSMTSPTARNHQPPYPRRSANSASLKITDDLAGPKPAALLIWAHGFGIPLSCAVILFRRKVHVCSAEQFNVMFI